MEKQYVLPQAPGKTPEEDQSVLGLAARIAAQAATARPNEGGTAAPATETPDTTVEGALPTNRAPSNYNPPPLRPLRTAIDSLYLSFQGELDTGMGLVLQELKDQAQHESEVIQASAQITLESQTLAVLSHGKKRYPFILNDHRFQVDVGRGGSMPLAVFQIKSQYLTEAGVREAVRAATYIANSLGHVKDFPKVSRADLCADFVPLAPIIQCPNSAWVTRAKTRTPHYKGEHFTGWSIGTGDVSARLYDKLFEVVTESRKEYLFALWQLAGWIPGEPVWRLEGQLRRAALKEMGILGVDDLLAHLDGLWAYCFRSWLVLKIPQEQDSNVTRWPVDPLWQALQEITFGDCTQPALIRGRPCHLPSDEWMFQNGIAPITAFMAKEGITEFLEGAAAFFLAAQDYFQKKGEPAETYVARKVRLKARKFGTLNNRKHSAKDEAQTEKAAMAYRKAKEGKDG